MSSPFSTGASPAGSSGASVFHERCRYPEHALLVRRHRLPATTASRVVALFSVLSDPTRLQVVDALLRAPSGEVCVGDLAAGLGRDNTTISHQLCVLRMQHMVTIRKVGRVAYYHLVDERIRHLLAVGLTYAQEPLPAEVSREMEVSG